jgi:hypothetical protein
MSSQAGAVDTQLRLQGFASALWQALPRVEAGGLFVGKASRQRQLKQERERKKRRAAQPSASAPPSQAKQPSQRELVAVGVAEALQALAHGQRDKFTIWVDALADADVAALHGHREVDPKSA